MNTYKPEATWSRNIREAIIALSKDEDEKALHHANVAMDYALYKMMQPVDSQYVKEAQALRMTVFTLRRLDAFYK